VKIGVCPSNDHARKKWKSSRFGETWKLQYQKLKEYHRINGDCNVPRCWEQDRSLGIWVHNQRRWYNEMKTVEAIMDSDRIQKLEELGFQWTLRKPSQKSTQC
jgi:hypothetical protein